MKRIRITKEFCFEMAHALKHHDGPCKHIHGHSYKLEVTVLGTVLNDPQSPKQGMVMDFSDLKQLVQKHIIAKLDHALVLCEADIPEFNPEGPLFEKLVRVDYQPTCENLLLDFASTLHKQLSQKVKLVQLTLHETPTSQATWCCDDNEFPGNL